MNILIINTKPAIQRREFQTKQLERLSLPFTIIEALSAHDLDNDIYIKHKNDWQRPLKNTELACYFSHKKAWEQVLKNKAPALILEDDALLSKKTPEILKNLESTTNIDFVTLEVRGRKKYVGNKQKKISEENNIVRLHLDRTGAAAYILWPSGAKKLIAHEKRRGVALADAHITSCSNLLSYQAEPAAAIQLDQCSHYNLNREFNNALTTSSVSSHQTEKKNIYFRYKRIKHQIYLGFKQLPLLFIAKKRLIAIDKSHFI